MFENVRGLASKRFDGYRDALLDALGALGYHTRWSILAASEFGVPQLRPRFVLVGFARPHNPSFTWPTGNTPPCTVGETLKDLMAANGWSGADAWAEQADAIAPTIVGGSKKHGGPDLGPTRAKEQWRQLGVNGKSLADTAPMPGHALDLLPKLTLRMVARLQGFPDSWHFVGRKTAAYRQVGNAFPPPVAQAVGHAISNTLYMNASTRFI